MSFVTRRPVAGRRRWNSPAVEEQIRTVVGRMRDAELAWLFSNCLPNTLDTTVAARADSADGDGAGPVSIRGADTFVITGDIDAMWLRDSTAQVWPYLPLLREDDALRELMAGVINRQAQCVRIDPYANAFLPSIGVASEWKTDQTEMRPGVHERKYELDSLCSVLRLSVGYFRACGDRSCFDRDWREAVELIVQTIEIEQRGSDEADGSPYRFARRASRGTDTQPLAGGECYPYRRCGLSRSPFRPSDDACQLAFPIAANAMAVVCLRGLAELLDELQGERDPLAKRARALAGEIDAAIARVGIHEHPVHGAIYAYEVDGMGSRVFMDDANVPSLLSLPYLGYCRRDDPLYQRTRGYLFSSENPFYAGGSAGRGIGGPHVGVGWIWPISIIMQAMTSDDDAEIIGCLEMLKRTHAGTGFMHESFWKDDATKFTRSWFAWANTLFGELILMLDRDRPHLLGAR
jgi:meiotically up-regulated gene 157 (Mug157) protein